MMRQRNTYLCAVLKYSMYLHIYVFTVYIPIFYFMETQLHRQYPAVITRVHLQFWKISRRPIWSLVDSL